VLVTLPGESGTEISVQQACHGLRQFVQALPFGHFQVALVNTSPQMVPYFIKRASGLPAKLSILLVTEPPEALCNVSGDGRGSTPKLARRSKFLEIRKRPSRAIDLLSQLSGDLPYFQILKISDWSGISQRRVSFTLMFPSSSFQFLVPSFQFPISSF
jgi:hypothetical protein